MISKLSFFSTLAGTALLLFLSGCDRENFDLVDEQDLPRELVVAEDVPSEPFFRLSTEGDTLITSGVLQLTANGDFALLVSSNDYDITCKENGFEVAITNSDLNGFFGVDDQDRLTLLGPVNYTIPEGSFGAGASLGPTCWNVSEGRIDARIEDGFVRGEVTGYARNWIAFLIENNGRFPTDEDCLELPKYLVRAEFYLPVAYCAD